MAGCGFERGRVLALAREQLDAIEEKVRSTHRALEWMHLTGLYVCV